jgi:hypothetical protein
MTTRKNIIMFRDVEYVRAGLEVIMGVCHWFGDGEFVRNDFKHIFK